MRWWIWVVIGCTDSSGNDKTSPKDESDGDSDADSDGDTDADSDGDSDADSDGDSDADSEPTCADATNQPISESEFASLLQEKFCSLWNNECGSGECPPVAPPPSGCAFDPEAACACLDADWQCNAQDRPSPAPICQTVYDCSTSWWIDSGDSGDSGIPDDTGAIVQSGDTGATLTFDSGITDTSDTGIRPSIPPDI